MSSVLTVRLDGQGTSWSLWTNVVIERDLDHIAGGFDIEYIDDGRIAQSLPTLTSSGPFFEIVRVGMAVTLLIDNEPVLVGYIDDVEVDWTADHLSARLRGRDKTGDLVDCAALPDGPAEFSGVDILHVAQKVCAPYGIVVRADVDIGETFDRLSKYPHETALSFLEKAARERALLLVSDGVGGLLLTRGGSSDGPSPITRPGNALGGRYTSSWQQRFSDYYVKGQSDGRVSRGAAAAPLTPATVPPSAAPADMPWIVYSPSPANIIATGHARDPEITRYRPTVRLTRSQSGMSTTQVQADWALRVAKGQGEKIVYPLLGWRAGPANALWRTNARVTVTDAYADIDKPMLIAGVRFMMSERGQMTELRVAGITAYDRINEAEKRRHRTTNAPGQAVVLTPDQAVP